MRTRHKLAFKYFLGAVLCFIIGFGVAWASSRTPGTKKEETKPSVVASVAPKDDQKKLDQTDKKKPTPKAGQKYTVKAGDTLSSIAEANGVTFEQLSQYNNIPYPYNLSIGQEIAIPGS